MKVVFFGSSRFVIPVLEMLHNYFSLALVVTTEQGNMDAVPFFCKAKKIPFIRVRRQADLISSYELQSSGADIGVVADFGLIIPPEVLSFFPMGVINIHPSLLPLYRGPSPAQASILNGDTKTGVSIIELDKNMDHGPIVAQVEEDILPTDTSKSLYEKLFKKGTSLLQNILSKFESQKVQAKPQEHEKATFTKFLTRDDGYIDAKGLFSDKIFFDRMVRAYYPWPGVWTKLILSENEQEKIVKFLPGNRIQVEGGKEMDYKDFINGYPKINKDLLNFLAKQIQ